MIAFLKSPFDALINVSIVCMRTDSLLAASRLIGGQNKLLTPLAKFTFSCIQIVLIRFVRSSTGRGLNRNFAHREVIGSIILCVLIPSVSYGRRGVYIL